MIEHYNAFISYKHADLDNKIAEHVQKKLEHFHIPAKIQKQTGKKKIERVFRDKDELPITSDLTETISYALEHADYLIVICSTNTKKSIWVKREIEFFLKTHDRSRILTVLCDGEPYDVIPEELTTQEKTVIDENGNEVTITTSMEPLSCDYRQGLRKGDKEELPRLASAIIGCSYDELMNRRRQYRTRQMVLVFSLVISMLIALGSYFFWTTRKIQDSLQTAKISQARYYAGESERLLEQDQRIKAIQLALMALPSEENPDCPIIPEAQRALTDSTYAYVTQSGLNPGAIWSYSMSTDVIAFEVSPDNKYLAGRDVADNITVWNLESRKPVLQLGAQPVKSKSMLFVNNDTLVIVYDGDVAAYNVSSGELIWDIDIYCSGSHIPPQVSEGGKYLLLSDSVKGVGYLEIETGTIVKYIKNDFTQEGLKNFFSYAAFPNKDLSRFINYGKAYNSDLSESYQVIGVCDATTGSDYLLGTYDIDTVDVKWISDSKVIIALMSEYDTMHYTDAVYVTRSNCEVFCLETKTGEIIWDKQFDFMGDCGGFGLFEIVTGDRIACTCGEKYVVFNLADGEILVDCEMTSEILTIADRHNTGNLMVVTGDGNVVTRSDEYPVGSYFEYPLLPKNLIMAEVHDVLYLVQSGSSEIILFDFNLYDENWTSITDKPLKVGKYRTRQFAVEEGMTAVMSTDSSSVDVFDTGSDENILHVDLIKYYEDLETAFPMYDVLGIRDGKVYIAMAGYSRAGLLSIDIKSGKVSEIFMDTENFFIPFSAEICGDKIFYLIDYTDYETRIGFYDMTTGKSKEMEMESIRPGLNVTADAFIPKYFEDIDSVFYVDSEMNIVLWNVGKNKKINVEVPENWQGTKVVALSPDGNLYLTDNTRIAVVDQKGKLKTVITCNQGTVNGLAFYTDKKSKETVLLATTTTGYLCRYDISDMSSIGSNKIAVFDDENFAVYMNFDLERNDLYIYSKYTMSMVDVDNWYEVAVIKNAIGHCNKTDKIYTFSPASNDGYGIGYFKHYTIQDLIQMGKDILGDYQMSDEEKASYGG